MAANLKVIASNPIDLLLDRLTGVKQTRPDRWQARCPAHDDRSPSLAVTETPDGTILIKCWAGCSAADVVGAAFEMRNFIDKGKARKIAADLP